MHFCKQTPPLPAGAPNICPKPKALPPNPSLNNIFQTDKCATTDKEDIRRIDLNKLLLRVFSASFWRDARDRPFNNLEQRLLDTLTGNISRNRRIISFSGNLIDLIDIDNSLLTFLDINSPRFVTNFKTIFSTSSPTYQPQSGWLHHQS